MTCRAGHDCDRAGVAGGGYLWMHPLRLYLGHRTAVLPPRRCATGPSRKQRGVAGRVREGVGFLWGVIELQLVGVGVGVLTVPVVTSPSFVQVLPAI